MTPSRFKKFYIGALNQQVLNTSAVATYSFQASFLDVLYKFIKGYS